MTQLCWNAEGTVLCEAHAPRRGSEYWRLDRWAPMDADTIALYTEEEGRPPECEACAKAQRERR